MVSAGDVSGVRRPEAIEQSSKGGHLGGKRIQTETNRQTCEHEIIVYQGKRSRKNFVLCDNKKVTNLVPGFCPLYYNREFAMPTRETANEMYDKWIFCNEADMNKLWVIHTDPKLLKMTGCQVLDWFGNGGSLKGKGFESVRRMMRSVERTWYSVKEKSRFWQVMPPEWGRAILESGGFILDQEMKDMFTGPSIDYNVETCHMIWVPVEDDEGISVLYGFNMSLDIVHVMDPRRTNSERKSLETMHSAVCSQLLDGLFACVDAFFDGWEINKNDWSFLYHEYQNPPCTDEETYLYTIHSIMYFDDITVTQHLSKDLLDDLSKKLMVMVVDMPRDIGHLPLRLKGKVG